MDEHRDEIRFEQVGPKGVGRGVPILTFLIGILLGAALVKPWDLVFPPTTTVSDARPTSIAASGATPSSASSPSPARSRPPAECAFAGGWRVFALGQRDRLGGDGSTARGPEPSDPPGIFADIGNPLRRWLEVDPLRDASQPDYDLVPFVTIVSERIRGIGYCPPPSGIDGPPTGSRLEAWSVDEGGAATALTLEPVTLDASTVVEVDVFIAEEADPDVGGHWAAGRYVFAVSSPDEGGYGRWFGVEIRTPPGRPPG